MNSFPGAGSALVPRRIAAMLEPAGAIPNRLGDPVLQRDCSRRGQQRSATLIVTGSRLMAARTYSDRTTARPHYYFNALFIGAEVGVLVDKAAKTVAAV